MEKIWCILGGLLLFFFTVILHEIIHFLMAKHYGLKPRFKWVSSKEKNTVGVFGRLPGVRFRYEDIPLYQLKKILLAPMPICSIGFFFMLIVFFLEYWSNAVLELSTYLLLGVTIVFSIALSYVASNNDIKDYRKLKKIWEKQKG